MASFTIQTPEGPKTVVVPWKTILTIFVIVVALLLLNSTYYSVAADEVGIVQRFGAYVGPPKPPGLHFKLPWGIEEVTKVPVTLVRKQEFGFRTVEAGVQTRYAPRSRDLTEVSLMLTGDLNCAEVEWSVQYTIKDPAAFLFNVRAPETTLRDMSESIMREMVGERSVTEVLTKGRQEINVEVKRQLQETLDSYGAGVNVTQVILQDVNPPEEVRASFNEVNQAQQEMDRTINEAWRAYNQAVPKARGDALKMISEAKGYAAERVNRAFGDVARFNNILAEYRKAEDITRTRLYLETMSGIMPKIRSKTIIDGELESVLPLLDLGEKGGRK